MTTSCAWRQGSIGPRRWRGHSPRLECARRKIFLCYLVRASDDELKTALLTEMERVAKVVCRRFETCEHRPGLGGARLNEATVRAMLRQHFEYAGSDPDFAHQMYHDDAVFEFPQSGERFVGLENFREWRSTYPANTSMEIREVRGRDDLWVAEISIRYDEGPRNFGISILEFRGDRIARESIYVAEGWEPPEWRAQWSAAP
jgi:hypothetical protein